uniref:Uncharacterized protein n=1 Tax=viral metagenome TaxID=1070528 RepID=A0A6C0LU32_9ZZZZ
MECIQNISHEIRSISLSDNNEIKRRKRGIKCVSNTNHESERKKQKINHVFIQPR